MFCRNFPKKIPDNLIGILKIAVDRQRTYLGYLMLAFLVENFIARHGWHWWYLLAIPIMIVISWIDYFYILPEEQSAAFRKHPQMREWYEYEREERESKNYSRNTGIE